VYKVRTLYTPTDLSAVCIFNSTASKPAKIAKKPRSGLRHGKILEEREGQSRQCALVLYGLKELNVHPQ